MAEFLSLLFRHKVHYLIVGGEAVIHYGHSRLTGDIDIFYQREAVNAARIFAALKNFWDGNVPGMIGDAELLRKGIVLQFGVPPNRIDLMNMIEGVEFDDAWLNRTDAPLVTKRKKVLIHYLGLGDLIKNKEAVGRHRDLDDLHFLKSQAARIRRKSRTKSKQ